MNLLDGIDPEEARRIIDPALELMMHAVHRYEGYVAQSTGDGIFALFGAPIAHETHAQRALFAAVRMQEDVRKYGERLRFEKGVNLAIRVGVNTGEVVLRSIRKDDLRTDYTPIGHSTGLAARMESLALPGSILVTEHTYKLTDGHFAFRPLGPTPIKGASRPLNVYEVLGAGPLITKLEIAARRGLTPFVGRDSEIAHLDKCLRLAKSGRGQIVGVVGEAGVGKSRLFHEFKTRARKDCLLLEGFAVSHGKTQPLLPLLELLKTYFDIHQEDDEVERRRKIAAKMAEFGATSSDSVPHLFGLMGVLEADSPIQQLEPPARRTRSFEAVKQLVSSESQRQPVVIVIEDLHWIDSDSEAFLATLTDWIPTARVLVLLNYRPEYQQPFSNKSYFSQIRLDPLEETSASEMLVSLLGDEADLRPLQHLILQNADGTPFFIEEIVRSLFDTGVLVQNGRVRLLAKLSEIRIPSTVEGVLAARIDRLAPDEKHVLQMAAVVGREFPLAVLGRMTATSADQVRAILLRLQSAEYVYEQLATAEIEYIFKHALTREVAYNSLLVDERTRLHERAAHAIEHIYRDRLEEHYDELGYHYSHSGNVRKAIDNLRLAGQQAMRRSANAGAVSHFAAALELLKTLSENIERLREELDLQIVLGTCLMASKGYAVPEVEQVFNRAREITDQLPETPHVFRIIHGLGVFHCVRGEHRIALGYAERFLNMAQHTQDAEMLVMAHLNFGEISMLMGNLELGGRHLEDGLKLYDPERHQGLAFVYGHDPRVFCSGLLALDLWMRGYPEQAWVRAAESKMHAESLGHFNSLGSALFYCAMIRQFRREVVEVQRFADEMIAFSTDHDLPYWLKEGRILRGWARAERGDLQHGIHEMREALASARAAGARLGSPHRFATMAEAQAKAGDFEGASRSAAEGIGIVMETEELWWEPDLHRLKGEFAERVSDDAEAEASFVTAIEIAQRQNAKSFELRATTSLARLWARQGRQQEAYDVVNGVYRWFTEGFETFDLTEAKKLLESLRQSRNSSERSIPDHAAATRSVIFHNEVDYWAITYQGTTVRLRDSKGIKYIADLVQTPDVEFHVTELIFGSRDHASVDVGDAGAVLDARAKQQYKARLDDLASEIEEAERFNDQEKASKARAEIESIRDELASATGLGGRGRKMGSSAERARVLVRKAIKEAMDRIRAAHRPLGEHLSKSLKTGYFCSYRRSA